MRRWFCIAAYYLVLLAIPLWAQRHGGSGGRGISGAGQSHTVRSFSGAGGRYNFGSSGTNFHISQDFGRRPAYPMRSGRNEFNHRGFDRRRSLYPYGAYYPYYGYYWNPYYPSDHQDYENENGYSDGDAGRYNPTYRDDSNLDRDVQSLNGKIDRLQADVEGRNRPREQEPSTALVFRDQHVLEVRNYAISGGTLWVLSEQQAKKIPLAELDLNATAKMNDDRGVDFQVPK